MIDTICGKSARFRVACHVPDVHKRTAYEKLVWKTSIEVRGGYTPDITLLT